MKELKVTSNAPPCSCKGVMQEGLFARVLYCPLHQSAHEMYKALVALNPLIARLLGTGGSPTDDYELRMAWNVAADNAKLAAENAGRKGEGP